MQNLSTRKIVHVDMDAFYASVEQLDNPSLRGKAIAVGGEGARGVITTASYEARKYGVKSAMPGYKARQMCPHLIFVPVRFSRYKEISREIRDIFHEYTDLVEPLSLDEAFLDVSHNHKGIESGIKVAKEIKTEILNRTGLTASAGVSINKFLAKIASDLHKPNGLSVILPEDIDQFIDELPIEKFFGVGKATAKNLYDMDIRKGCDLKQYSEFELASYFGKLGRYLYKVCQGIDDRPVVPDRIRKSISVETTYDEDIASIEDIQSNLLILLEDLYQNLIKYETKGKTLTLKLRFKDFSTITRSKSAGHFTSDISELQILLDQIVQALQIENRAVRLLGLGMNNLESTSGNSQLSFNF